MGYKSTYELATNFHGHPSRNAGVLPDSNRHTHENHVTTVTTNPQHGKHHQAVSIVPLKGGRWHIIIQLAVYASYIAFPGE